MSYKFTAIVYALYENAVGKNTITYENLLLVVTIPVATQSYTVYL